MLTQVSEPRQRQEIEAGVAEGSGADEFERLLTVRLDLHADAAGAGGDDHSLTNSAEAVLSRLNPLFARRGISDVDRGGSGVFLFPVNDGRLRGILPSPLNEVAGVFHMKAYIVDDEMVLSGANLSEEYFNNRLDRYMLFTNGGGGLVDFYADLCDVLCEYAIRYDRRPNGGMRNLSTLMSSQDEKARKRELELSLARIFDGRDQSHDP